MRSKPILSPLLSLLPLLFLLAAFGIAPCALATTPPSELVTLTVVGNGTVTSNPAGIICSNATCTATFPLGTSVTLTSTLPTGTSFVAWGGACGAHGVATCYFQVSGPTSINALFSSVFSPITVTIAAGSGQAVGTVVSDPAGVNCPSAACTGNFSTGSSVTLNASAAAGFIFAGWGAPCSGNGVCILTAREATALTATFVPFAGVSPQTGYWWNPAQGGRGYMIEQSGVNLFFAAYLYDDAGNATWLAAGPAPLSGSTFTAPLNRYAGGQTLTGKFVAASVGASPGSVTLQFTDTQHATMTWPGGATALERYGFVSNGLTLPPQSASQPENGYWWSPAEGGRGYGIEIQGNTAFIASYMYNANGSPVWYATLNPLVSVPGRTGTTLSGNDLSFTYSGTWSLYANGQSLAGAYRSAAVVNSNVGAVAIQFSSSHTATLTLPDGRQIQIQRFTF